MSHDKYRAALEAEKTRLEAELDSVAKRDPVNPADWDAATTEATDDLSDPNDNADRMAELDQNEAITTQLESERSAVADALARLDAGTYGTCEVCHQPIEEDRLDANPAARTCKAHING